MDSGGPLVREFFYGCDDTRLFVRIDGAKDTRFGIEFESGAAEVKTAKGRITELEAPRCGNRFRLTMTHDGLPPVAFPSDGWIELPEH